MPWFKNLLKGTRLVGLALAGSMVTCAATDRELIRDAHFQNGFYLLDPKPGKRVVYATLPGLDGALSQPALAGSAAPSGEPCWDLAQWSSKVPLQRAECSTSLSESVCSNAAKCVIVGKPGTAAADISLAVNAGREYGEPRKKLSDPWVHLLVQQDFRNPPALGALTACNLHVEARLKKSRLVTTSGYSPSLHAAQFLLYLTVANRNSKANGYNECFWFGVPIYDDRERMVSHYEAQDFGDTKLFIFTPATARFASKSIHDGEWVVYEQDLLPQIREALAHARAKGFIKGSTELADYRPLGVFVGWEVPGIFDVDLQIRNLSLKASPR